MKIISHLCLRSFPYADRKSNYWTGYFTSRVALKVLAKETGRYL